MLLSYNGDNMVGDGISLRNIAPGSNNALLLSVVQLILIVADRNVSLIGSVERGAFLL